METAAADVVKAFLEGFAAGDIQAALACLAPDCVVDEAHGLPFSGSYRGPDGFLELLGAMSARLDAKVNSIEVLDAGATAVGRIELTFVGRATGRELTTTAVEVYRVHDGRITHADVYYKDPAAVSALLGS